MKLFEAIDATVETETGNPILEGISLTIKKSQITAVIGSSGAGKSVFARMCVGLLPNGLIFKSGTLFFKGQEIIYPLLNRLRGKNILYIPQNAGTAFNPILKIRKQIQEVYSGTKEMLEGILKQLMFEEPARVLNAYPFQLSGGELQRCLLVLALAMKPELIIFDEPESALDWDIQDQFLSLLMEIQKQYGLTVLYLSHHMRCVRIISHYIYKLEQGKVVCHGLNCPSINASGGQNPRHPVGVVKGVLDSPKLLTFLP